jgi:hypothetical protein
MEANDALCTIKASRVILSAAKNLSRRAPRFFAALKMTIPALKMTFPISVVKVHNWQ